MIVLSLLRSLVASMFFMFFTGLCSLAAMVAAFLPDSQQRGSEIISTWGRVALKMFGVRLVTKGIEHVPEGSCLFLFNHTSFFDIFAMVSAYPDFRFGAKIELFKIPLFGRAMKKLGILPIARNRREEVFRVYQEAQERAQRGEKFALSPEGQRNVQETLLPFKSGPFIFAINSGIPIVPVVIQGAHAVLGKGSYLPNWDRWQRTIVVEYLPVVETKRFSLEQRAALQEEVRQAMLPLFSQNPISQSALNSFGPQRPKILS